MTEHDDVDRPLRCAASCRGIFSQAQPVGRRRPPAARRCGMHHPKADLALIERAYAAAEKAHAGQKRKSGEPYITHPVAVAQILADLGIGVEDASPPPCCTTPSRTPTYTLDQVRADFGDEIAMLVDGVTKLDKVKYGDSAQAETVRKMIVAMSKDIRVLDHQARRPPAQRPHLGLRAEPSRRTRKAQETLEIYAPLAHRLGIQAIKWELEDLSFAVLYPKLYVEIESLVKQRTPQREEFVQQVIDAVNEDLKAGEDQGQGRRPAEAVLLDLPEDDRARPRVRRDLRPRRHPRARELGARLLRRARRDPRALEPDARAASRTTSRPRSSTSTSRCTRRSSARRAAPVEIQIRTHEMHQRAEFGVAAHWKYKERINGGKGDDDASSTNDTDMAWLAHISDWQAETADPGEFLDSCASRSARRRSTSSRRRARSSACPPARPRSTSPTPCTPRSATARWARRSTAGSCRSRASSSSGDVVEVFTSKNPDCRPEPGLAELRQEPARAQQDPRSGSPRSAATRRSSRARTRSPARCASRTCRCRS